MAQMTMIQAITHALDLELARDERVLVFGEDVGNNGGVFRATEGLQKKYGADRVFDTPLAESGIIGLANGLAIQGFRPVPEIQFFGFVFEAFDQIAGQLARTRYRSGGRYTAPVTIRSPFGGGVHTPEMHADSLEGLFVQTPGIKVVIPSNPYEAKGLLLAAIRDPDPVIFLEHMKLYRSFRQEVPEDDYTIPLGVANVVREGKDATVIAYGAMVGVAQKAAEQWSKEKGFEAEVIDLRTISPIDIDTIVKSIQKTNRAIVVQEAQRSAGAAAEIVAQINEQAIYHLEAPVLRATPPDTVYPFGMIEDEWLPTPQYVVDTLNKVMTL
ncbi:Transketolase central region [Alicyclobacillus hesperidum URH17-3-68]|uniref:Pyruvate dehydrogenase E1 component beta subunit n=1 Tax=Alicyclobacillus hesperidum TaxID=89784 RepID=A0A1H2W9I6_9BACL|nr:alpha-ketoacid dehydrogenase subunit beta [Alicyclobacillus hesperidum]EJY56149.1 Transketolase central region [Alicyclobacillus hesperidum URH17-3-68]GLV14516.1 pyruvate dehydrogenase E1 component subunit beta [Alicyclobacillus hesperidum]SDW77116.1 pyruvate dehydrogenase E1 component beta subunit [Alicyclobacillus hesperidum]